MNAAPSIGGCPRGHALVRLACKTQAIMNAIVSRRQALVAALGLASASGVRAQGDDPWAPVRPLLGKWVGASSGRPGEASVSRTYAFVIGGKYIQETNVSVYPPQERNPRGERHEHWGFFSYDRSRKSLVLRQFHVEGFVNTAARYRTGP